MKIAIQNPFAEQRVAETELSRRISLAATRLGWQAAEVCTAIEIKACQPDFVIALHNNSPKLAEFPTYGCMWNPPSFFEGTELFVKHVFTYDGYLTSSGVIDRWLHQLLYTTPKRYFVAPFYTSCPATVWQPPNLNNPRLAYLGSNWDGPRFRTLFEGLDDLEFMQVYGNPEGWNYLHSAYKGSLPYDGLSVLNTLNQAGVGLCLHRSEHRQAALPSMRIFEIVAAGAVAICTEHPFIRSVFADTVLYIDPDAEIATQIAHVSQHMQWIQEHPDLASAMARQAHQIFSETYTLEKLLLGVASQHQESIFSQNLPKQLATPESDRSQLPSVEFIVRVNNIATAQSLLNQITRQTYPNLKATIVKPKFLNLDTLITFCPESFQNQISLKVLESNTEYSSTSLWTGLQTITAEYFALLDETGEIYPNHVQTLISLLQHHPHAGLAYAGTRRTLITAADQFTAGQPETDKSVAENSEELTIFQPFNLDRFLRFNQEIAPHSFIARRSLLDHTVLQDPQLQTHETLCLLLHLAQRTSFLFSYELTCEVYQQTGQLPLLQQFHNWESELSRLKFIFWHQEFAPGKSLQAVHQEQFVSQSDYQALRSTMDKQKAQIQQLRQTYQQTLQQSQAQLETAQATITAMQTSKFWQLRSAWFKLKRSIGLPTRE